MPKSKEVSHTCTTEVHAHDGDMWKGTETNLRELPTAKARTILAENKCPIIGL